MYKICIMEDSAKRQRQLENGFLSVLQTQTYEDISISDLCRQLEITRRCFYRYFSGKEGILTALLDHTLMDFASSFIQYTPDPLASGELLEYFFQFWKDQKPLLDALERNGLSMYLYQRALDFSSQEIGMFSELLSSDNKLIRNQRVQFIVCGMMTMAISWHHAKYQPSQKEMVHAAKLLLTRPLFQ